MTSKIDYRQFEDDEDFEDELPPSKQAQIAANKLKKTVHKKTKHDS